MTNEPFTLEFVHGLLKTVLKGSQCPPAAKSLGVRRLTHRLNQLQRTEEYRRDHQLPAKVKSPLRLVIKEVLKLRAKCVAASALIGAPDPAILTLDAFVAAAEAVKLFPGIAQARATNWQYYARSLVRLFRECTGGSAEAAYRFIEAAVPRISGEKPTHRTVRTSIVDRRVQRKLLAVPGTKLKA